MNIGATHATLVAERAIVMERVYEAPRELVFQAWTEAERLGEWWGPNGFTTTTLAMDFRPGGAWRFIMHGPDGTDYPNRITYQEIVAPERLVYDHDDDDDSRDTAFHVTVTFEQEGAGTRLTMRTLLPTPEERDRVVKFGAVEGGRQTLDHLAEYLARRA